jgi:hypothetical protein
MRARILSQHLLQYLNLTIRHVLSADRHRVLQDSGAISHILVFLFSLYCFANLAAKVHYFMQTAK